MCPSPPCPSPLPQMDDEPFNPDYVEVDRVLDVSESPDENGEVGPVPSVPPSP